MQEGPVEVLTVDGQLLKLAQAQKNGFFYYRGFLPPDFRLRAQRGTNTFESEYHGGWQGGTLYINAGTTLACAYRRAHPDLAQDQVEGRIRAFFNLPGDFPMSWVSTVRAGFNTKDYFRKAGPAGVNAYNGMLIAQMDSAVRPLGLPSLEKVFTDACSSIFGAAVNSATGDSVARMGFNYTTAGALSQIQAGLAEISTQLAELNQELTTYAATENLKSVLAPLREDAQTIDLTIGNITNTISSFQQTHPDADDYNVPGSNPEVDNIVGQVQSLNLTALTADIANSITDTSTNGLYRLLVAQQMSARGQSDTSFNGYSWRNNDMTGEQILLFQSFASSLSEAGYLQSEFAHLQTDLAGALTQAAASQANTALQIQKASQQVPDLFAVDEINLDPQNKIWWFGSFGTYGDAATAGSFAQNLQVGPYDDWGLPSQSMVDTLVKKRIGPATLGAVDTSSTWDNVDGDTPTTWPAAFNRMGINAVYNSNYGYDVQPTGGTNNEGCWFDNTGFTTSSQPSNMWFYDWNGTNNNPSTFHPVQGTAFFNDSTPQANVLVCRLDPDGFYPSVPVRDALTDHSSAPTNGSSVSSSPMECCHPINTSLDFTGPTPVMANGTTLGYQVGCIGQFLTPAPKSGVSNSGPKIDITRRVFWDSDDPTTASISNLLPDPSAGAPTVAPGGCGFVTWHPPLDGSALKSVTIHARLFASVETNGGTETLVATETLTPPTNCVPVLTEIYANPLNQVLDVSSGGQAIAMKLLAFYQDGRIFDISTDDSTTWTLRDSNGNVLNNAASGGFGVRSGNSPKNELYVTGGISTANVTFTADYAGRWGTRSFSGTMGLIKQGVTITSAVPALGPVGGGTRVLVRGTGFVPGTVASVGGNVATTYYDGPTQLTIITPAAAASGSASIALDVGAGPVDTGFFFNYTP